MFMDQKEPTNEKYVFNYFFCLPFLFLPFTVPCLIFAKPADLEIWPSYLEFIIFSNGCLDYFCELPHWWHCPCMRCMVASHLKGASFSLALLSGSMTQRRTLYENEKGAHQFPRDNLLSLHIDFRFVKICSGLFNPCENLRF